MTNAQTAQPHFNLWCEPWIRLEDENGDTHLASIETALLEAHHYRAIAEMSPVNVVGIHRLLAAIAQDMLAPGHPRDLGPLWRAGCFAREAVAAFGAVYAERFDLFRKDKPFMQSAKLGLSPRKGQRVKSVVYLAPDWPAATEITHYRHGIAEEAVFCPICCAACLVAIPSFATSGGAGIRPSINGVPPIYVIAVGENLFEGLLASVVAPQFQPRVRDPEQDRAWWRREPVVERRAKVYRVGYLHSLTFPARQVRLHPGPMREPCSRCGGTAQWGVQTMVYQMGEYRPKDAPFWFDPFVAYKMPKKGREGSPRPLRPQEGRALWRDFGALFLEDPGGSTQRPTLLDQFKALTDQSVLPYDKELAFRCVGMRTDGRAKIFEWVDQGVDVPVSVLTSESAAVGIHEGLRAAETAEGFLRFLWRKTSGSDGPKHHIVRERMLTRYWQNLAGPFREFVLHSSEGGMEPLHTWCERVLREAEETFLEAGARVGDDAASLRQRVQGEAHMRAWAINRRKEWIYERSDERAD